MDLFLEIIRAVLVGSLFTYLIWAGRRSGLGQDRGWGFILTGFGLLFFGMLIDISDNFPALGVTVVLGPTRWEALLEKVLGYLTGFFLLAVGFYRWLPRIVELKETRRELAELNQSLEKQVDHRTRQLEQANQALMERQEKLDLELSFAADVQSQIYGDPVAIQKKTGVSVYFEPWGRTSGDFYDVREREGSLIIFLADVSGHGVPAALITMMIRQSVERIFGGQNKLEPQEVLETINRELEPLVHNASYFTAQIVFVNPETGEVVFSSAGHPDIMVLRNDSEGVDNFNSGGTLVGIDVNARFPVSRFHLKSGDRLVVFTDGLVEGQSPAGSQWGDEGLVTALRKYPALSIPPRDLCRYLRLQLAEHMRGRDLAGC